MNNFFYIYFFILVSRNVLIYKSNAVRLFVKFVSNQLLFC